jgi:hypothetical protein
MDDEQLIKEFIRAERGEDAVENTTLNHRETEQRE